MSYWLTTHWPRREDESVNEPHHGVWAQSQHAAIIGQVKRGDLVAIYEAASGPTAVRDYADGTHRHIRCKRGAEGIVGLVRVIGEASQPDDARPETYTNGRTAFWQYYAPTESLHSAGFVPRRRVAELLGYKPTYVFRGFGEGHSGLKAIPEEIFAAIKDEFCKSARSREDEVVARTAAAPKFHGPGGEGPEHRALKNRVASDPAAVLGEPGLLLWKVEWGFPTGDRIDVVLKDEYDRFVAVEIEVDCDEMERAGPLQCMKYRAMLSYLFGRPLEEVRTMLVAHSVHHAVRASCSRHDIEVHEVARRSARAVSAGAASAGPEAMQPK